MPDPRNRAARWRTGTDRMGARYAIVSGFAALLLASCAPASEEASDAVAVPAADPAPQPEPAIEEEAVRPDFWIDGSARQGAMLIGQAPSQTVGLSFDGEAVPQTGEGFFLIAFDRDAPATAKLTATLKDGRTVVREFDVAPTEWRLEHINADYRGGVSSAEFKRRRAGELARINAARRVDVESDGWRQDFIRPVSGRVSGWFGSQRVYRGKPGSYHSGMDIAAPTGTTYVAPADGVVTLAADDDFTLEGKLLIIDHGMGLNSAFLHSSALLVREGDVVKQGQAIGRVGATGRATGPHLHWGMKWNAARIDPLIILGEDRN